MSSSSPTTTDLLKMGRMTLCGPVFRERLCSAFERTVEQTQDFTDSAYTSHERREKLLQICDRARSELNHLLSIAVAIEDEGSSTPTEDFENALTQTIRASAELKNQLQITAIEQAEDLFKLSDEIDILNKLKSSAMAADRNRLDEYSECFSDHAERVQEVCRLLQHVSTNETLQLASKNREACICVYSSQLLNAAQRLCMHPTSKVARENLEVFQNLWLATYSDVQQLSRDISELLLERTSSFATTTQPPPGAASQFGYAAMPPHSPASSSKHVTIREGSPCPLRSDPYTRPMPLPPTALAAEHSPLRRPSSALPPSSMMPGSSSAGTAIGRMPAAGGPMSLPCHKTATRLDSVGDVEQQAVIDPAAYEPMKGADSMAEQETSKESDEDNDIVRRAKSMSQMAFSMYQFTKGDGGELKTTQDLFTQAEFFAEEANKFYKVVRAFTYQVPSGPLKKELMENLAKVPALVQQLQFSVKNSTVGKAATFAKVDTVLEETKNLMAIVSKTVNSCLSCSQTYNVALSRARSRTLSPSARCYGDEGDDGFGGSSDSGI